MKFRISWQLSKVDFEKKVLKIFQFLSTYFYIKYQAPFVVSVYVRRLRKNSTLIDAQPYTQGTLFKEN